MRMASLGGSVAAACGSDGSVALLTGGNERSSKRSYALDRSWLVDDDLVVAAVGLVSDARAIADFAFDECRRHRHAFGTPPTATRLAESIANVMASAARQSRPLAVHVVVVGLPAGICHIEPTGHITKLRGVAAGNHADDLKRHLMAEFEDGVDDNPDDLLRRVWQAALDDRAKDDDDDVEDRPAPVVTVLRRRRQSPFPTTPRWLPAVGP